MGRYGVDYASVREAAEAIKAAGETVTVERVRAELGSGSFTTLGRHLRTWRRTKEAADSSEQLLPDLISDAAQTVWANLNQAAQAQVAEARAVAQTAIESTRERAKKDVAATEARLEQALREHKQHQIHAQQRLTESQDLIAELQKRLRDSDEQRCVIAQKAGHSAADALHLQDRLKEAFAAKQDLARQLEVHHLALKDFSEAQQATQKEHLWALTEQQRHFAEQLADWQTEKKGLTNQVNELQKSIGEMAAQKEGVQGLSSQIAELFEGFDQFVRRQAEQLEDQSKFFRGIGQALHHLQAEVMPAQLDAMGQNIERYETRLSAKLEQGLTSIRETILGLNTMPKKDKGPRASS